MLAVEKWSILHFIHIKLKKNNYLNKSECPVYRKQFRPNNTIPFIITCHFSIKLLPIDFILTVLSNFVRINTYEKR